MKNGMKFDGREVYRRSGPRKNAIIAWSVGGGKESRLVRDGSSISEETSFVYSKKAGNPDDSD